MKVLFFDIEITGHHSEYIGHLVNHLAEKPGDNAYFFVVHPDFSDKFPAIAFRAKQQPSVTWIEVSPDEYTQSHRGGMAKRSFLTFRLMNRYALQTGADRVHLLYFNTFQLACAIHRPAYKMSGILFLQFYRMDRTTWKDKIRYYRKYLITKCYVMNPALTRVFILNDQKSVDYLNTEFRTRIFRMLPDPVPVLYPPVDFDIYTHYKIDRSRKIFLHFGSLGDRKGTFEIIDAAELIPAGIQGGIAVLLVGRAVNETASSIILDKMEKQRAGTQVHITWDNQFVSNELMKGVFDQCFAVLIPYKNTETSSGILGHAAAANKKVIATGTGLIREIIEENELGVLISEVSAAEIGAKMTALLSMKPELSGAAEFVSGHAPAKFTELILN